VAIAQDGAMSAQTTARAIVVLGVSGSGKTTVGIEIAKRLSYEFCDADDLHSAANIEKMHSGHPLDDADRIPWLNAVGQHMRDVLDDHAGVVVACSALKKSYRDIIRTYEPAAIFALLDGSQDVIMSRVLARHGSFMPPSLLASQFATLEPLTRDEHGATVEVADSVAATAERVLATLSVDGASEN
jgi:carbohydrate kinase (thermoresistant glucokinase family)